MHDFKFLYIASQLVYLAYYMMNVFVWCKQIHIIMRSYTANCTFHLIVCVCISMTFMYFFLSCMHSQLFTYLLHSTSWLIVHGMDLSWCSARIVWYSRLMQNLLQTLADKATHVANHSVLHLSSYCVALMIFMVWVCCMSTHTQLIKTSTHLELCWHVCLVCFTDVTVCHMTQTWLHVYCVAILLQYCIADIWCRL